MEKQKTREEKVMNLRILELDKIIREEHYPSTAFLCRKLEVSRSTIMRDIEFLRLRYKAPVEFDKEKNGYYYSDNTFFVKSVFLSEGDLFTVSAVLPLLNQYKNTPIAGTMTNILQKIASMLPEKVSVDSEFIAGDISFISDPLPVIAEEVFYGVFEGIRNKCSITFKYRSLKDEEYKPREADPYHVVCQKGNWYVLAFCHKHREIRIFALSRVKDIKITSKKFQVPENFTPSSYFDGEIGIWNNREKPLNIEIEFEPGIKTYIIERKWHKTQKITKRKNGNIRLSFQTNQIQEVANWVLSFGAFAKVIKPPVLVEKIKNEAQNLLKKYETL